jgi:hypothetical protein
LSLTGMFVVGDFHRQPGDGCTIRHSQTCSSSHFYFKARGKGCEVNSSGPGHRVYLHAPGQLHVATDHPAIRSR